jgi:hypothetical protein
MRSAGDSGIGVNIVEDAIQGIRASTTHPFLDFATMRGHVMQYCFKFELRPKLESEDR